MSDGFEDNRLRCQEMAVRAPDGDPKTEAARWREVARLAMALAHECDEQYQRTVSLIVPGDIVKDLSPNKHVGWRGKMTKAKLWRFGTKAQWVLAGCPRFKPPVAVKIIVRRGRRVDDDNLVSSCKHARDGLWGVDCMLPADDKRYISSYEVVQQTGGRWGLFPEVEIQITGEPV